MRDPRFETRDPGFENRAAAFSKAHRNPMLFLMFSKSGIPDFELGSPDFELGVPDFGKHT